MKRVFHPKYESKKEEIESLIFNFDRSGEQLGKGDRNKIKLYELDGVTINVKSFKVPNIFNKIAYRFFRKSKAERSFEYANKLTVLGIGTPQPIAYYEFPTPLFYKKSFYVSEHQAYDLTYRELTHNLEYPDHETILRAFTRFSYNLHQNNILFLDHSPGNTLIKKKNDSYTFSLVDLNRMEFRPLSFTTRIKNFERLTVHESMVRTMSDEYAKCSGESFDKIFDIMWSSTQAFQEKFHKKKRLKKRLKFWK